MSKRFGRNRRRKMRQELEALTKANLNLRNANVNLRNENDSYQERLVRVCNELGRFAIMNPNPYTIAVHERVWAYRMEKANYDWKTIRDPSAPYFTKQSLVLSDARMGMGVSGFDRLFPFVGGPETHHEAVTNPAVFVPYISEFVRERTTHFAVRDVNTGLVVNYAFPTEVLFTVPRIDLCRILGERLGEIALQGLYEKFDATTHKEFLEALAKANKDPMRSSHKLSGRGVTK